MKYDELSIEEKNRLVARRIMGESIECSGRLQLTKDPMEWYCPECIQYWGLSEVDDRETFKHLNRHIPNYSESMDAAWQVLKRMNMFQKASDLEILASELLGTTRGDLSAFTVIDLLCDWTPDLICKAALSAVGAIDEHGEIVEAQP